MFGPWTHLIKFAPDDAGGADGAPATNTPPNNPGVPSTSGGSTNDESSTDEGPQSWDDVLKTLPESHRVLYDQHTRGLKTALDSEREQRSELTRQLREATKSLEKDSDARVELERISGELDEHQRRADFYEEASRPDVGCVNLRLAYMAAKADNLIDDRGRVHWDELKTSYPQLFRQPRAASPTYTGVGNNPTPPSQPDMDNWIRQRAGVRT